ncbi:MAG: glycosyltransferase family 4 protein [Chloroflexi bacterium]|nr:glycosyltransferase family 4 protein [Chloroflexota bacterium]
MRVLQVCHDFPIAVGGGAIHVHRVSRELVRLGNRVTVFTTDLIGKGERTDRACEEMDGISVRRFHATPIPVLGLDVGNIPFGLLPAILRQRDIDVIHVHSYRFFSTWIVPLLRLFKRNVPVVMTSHCAFEPSHPWRIRLFDATWGRLVFKSATRVIALTEIESEYLVSLGCAADKIHIIPNGVDSAVLDHVADVKAFRARFGITHAKVALFVGRIGLGKGLDVLVDAIPAVAKRFGGDVLFMFVGPDWGDRQELEQRAHSLGVSASVLFTGPLNGNTLLDAYQAADIVVLLSRFDASPLVIVEAMAAAKAVVATRVGGIPNIVRDGSTGLLVSSENSTEAAAAMVRLLSDRPLAEKYGQAGRQLVQRHYLWNQIAGQVQDVYAKAQGARRP